MTSGSSPFGSRVDLTPPGPEPGPTVTGVVMYTKDGEPRRKPFLSAHRRDAITARLDARNIEYQVIEGN